jgi:hypothetical protein
VCVSAVNMDARRKLSIVRPNLTGCRLWRQVGARLAASMASDLQLASPLSLHSHSQSPAPPGLLTHPHSRPCTHNTQQQYRGCFPPQRPRNKIQLVASDAHSHVSKTEPLKTCVSRQHFAGLPGSSVHRCPQTVCIGVAQSSCCLQSVSAPFPRSPGAQTTLVMLPATL